MHETFLLRPVISREIQRCVPLLSWLKLACMLPSILGLFNNSEILFQVIRSSPYLTADPHTACVLVPPYDTLDRDVLSADYETRLKDILTTLPYWNSGVNHLIFNFFSGTSPSYSHSLSSLNLDLGKAILVKASLSAYYYRRDFDISSPLIPKDFSLTHPNTGNIR